MTKSKLSTLLILSFLLLATLTGSLLNAGDGEKYSEAIQKFENYLNNRMAFDRAVGISVGFMKDGYVWTKGFGYADLENKLPMKAEGSFRMASITKTFTAIAVLQLVEQGKIDLDAEVQKYVPYFPKKKWPVTVRLLLGHLGGISHYRDYDKEGHIKVHKDTKESLEIFSGFDLVAEPGTRYRYSSYGFNLLGAVVEGASGQSYADYIKEHIFDPLGMENSRIDDPEDIIPNRVRGYRIEENKIENSEYVNMSSRFAGGGTRSTVVDLLKYAKGIMAGKLLKEKTWQQMFTSMATRAGVLTGYGMGFSISPLNGHFQVGHGGAQAETRTYLLILPRLNFAAAIGSNMEDTNPRMYLGELCEKILGEDLNSIVYSGSEDIRYILQSLSRVFSYGRAYHERHGKPLTLDNEKLKKAFAFFNTWVDKKVWKKQAKEAKKQIVRGMHPANGRAFTVIGSFMAQTLLEAKGKDALAQYPRHGYFEFFKDYIDLSGKWPVEKKSMRFSLGFVKRFSAWHRDWRKTYTDYVRHLSVDSVKTLKETGRLKTSFAGAKVYPNLTQDILVAGRTLLFSGKAEEAREIFSSCSELYPESIPSMFHLAYSHLWKGEPEQARALFKKAYKLNPEHPSLGFGWFNYFSGILMDEKKMDTLEPLASIILELHPKDPAINVLAGDIYLEAGKMKKADASYRKAISLGLPISRIKGILEKVEEAKKKKSQNSKEK